MTVLCVLQLKFELFSVQHCFDDVELLKWIYSLLFFRQVQGNVVFTLYHHKNLDRITNISYYWLPHMEL